MLLSMMGKVLCSVILDRLKDALDALLKEEQAGFRRGRSWIDQMATLRIIVEQSVEWQSSIYICFVDFAKAFDSVNRDVLFKLHCTPPLWSSREDHQPYKKIVRRMQSEDRSQWPPD